MNPKRTEADLREMLKWHETDLAMWQEPDGFLVPTEPDPDERILVRERLKAAIFVLRWVLGEPEPPNAVKSKVDRPGVSRWLEAARAAAANFPDAAVTLDLLGRLDDLEERLGGLL